MKGKLIVIDGGDGSGKTVQAHILVEALRDRGTTSHYFDFPQYESFYGRLVARFLRGEFGGNNEVSPYLASLPYALDRLQVKDRMQQILDKGEWIICNRYVTSNMGHMGAKFDTLDERKAYLAWVEEMEYTVNALPKEDVVIYLYVPWRVGVELTSQKGERGYLAGARQDIHEADHAHRQRTEDMFLWLADNYSHWRRVACVKDDVMRSKQDIHEEVVGVMCR